MEIHAWIQMGVERRETVIEIPDEEYERVKEKAEEHGASVQDRLEDYVRDWLFVQYGWGWSGSGFDVDCGFMEDSDSGGYGALAVTSDSSIPNTEVVRLDRDS